MSTVKFTSYGAVVTIMDSTVLSALASNAWAVAAADYDNRANQNLYADVEVVLASAISTSAAPSIDLYCVPSLDGTNFPNPPGNSATSVPSTYFVGTIGATGSATWLRGAVRQIVLPNGIGRFYLQNRLGNALPAGANKLLLYPYTEQVV